MQSPNEPEVLEQSPLGNHTQYVNQYDPSQLYPIERALNWQARGIERESLPFMEKAGGVDIWNAYELSWLNGKGKPCARVGEFRIPAQSSHIIESKSFKLYLNSFNLSRFDSDEQVAEIMAKDLSKAAGAEVEVRFFDPDQMAPIEAIQGYCIDHEDVEIEHYTPEPQLLKSADEQVAECLYSHLLKSNCPVTGQPDWASISIEYRGAKIDRAGLLKYLVSYREHGDFHEQCVENIFMDIWQQCQPQELTVYARYVRRGGLDINPLRSSLSQTATNPRLSRQ